MTREEHDAKYPMHAKVRTLKAESQAIGEFLEWLEGQDYQICEEVSDDPGYINDARRPITLSKDQLIAKYLGIDLKVFSAEKDAMYEELAAAVEQQAVSPGPSLP